MANRPAGRWTHDYHFISRDQNAFEKYEKHHKAVRARRASKTWPAGRGVQTFQPSLRHALDSCCLSRSCCLSPCPLPCSGSALHCTLPLLHSCKLLLSTTSSSKVDGKLFSHRLGDPRRYLIMTCVFSHSIPAGSGRNMSQVDWNSTSQPRLNAHCEALPLAGRGVCVCVGVCV